MKFNSSTIGRSGNWKAVIEYEPWSDRVKIWLAELIHDKTYVASVNKDGVYRDWETDRKSTRLNSSHSGESRMPSSA